MKRIGKQHGAALVESVIIILLFFVLIFAVMEFGFMLFTWLKGVEGVRAASRYAIVNDPVNGTDLSSCAATPPVSPSPVNCNGPASKCGQIVNIISGWLPQADKTNVTVTYSCSSTGYSGSPTPVVGVEVKVSGVSYNLMVPSLLGFPSTVTLPTMTSMRTGESLETLP